MIIDLLALWITIGYLWWMGGKAIVTPVKDYWNKDFMFFTIKCGPLALFVCLWMIFIRECFIKLEMINYE